MLNPPLVDQADMVDRLALTTASDPVPEFKLQRGRQYEPDKFVRSGFSMALSDVVAPPGAGMPSTPGGEIAPRSSDRG